MKLSNDKIKAGEKNVENIGRVRVDWFHTIIEFIQINPRLRVIIVYLMKNLDCLAQERAV